MRCLIVAWLGFLVCGCLRTRAERREVPVDTGVPLVFGEAGGAPLTWDFGDGSPRATSGQVKKAFARAGHYQVRAFDGERLAWLIELDAVPRPVTRAMPADAEWAVCARRVKADFSASLDLLERLMGPTNLQSLVDGSVLAQLAIDDSTLGRLVDPAEGIGAFSLPGLDATVVLLGVTDERATLEELGARSHAALDVAELAVGLELNDGTRALVFADRGYVYAVFPRVPEAAALAMQRIRSADGRGLELGAAYRALPPGAPGKALLLLAPRDRTELPIDALWATVSTSAGELRLEGRLLSKDPVWQTQGVATAELFAKAWDGPVAAVQVKLPPALVRAVLKPGSSEREASRQRLLAHGIDVEQMVRALTGDLGGLLWFDAEAFLRNLVEGTERPDPRGAALVELSVSDSAPWEAAVGQMLEVFLPVKPKLEASREGLRWSARLAGQDATLTVGKKALKAELGSGLKGRTLVDLSTVLAQRFDGAFGRGHASLLLDVGRLRAELGTPRMIDGLDMVKVVTVQGYASAFLDSLTPIDHLLLDLAPTRDGARLSGRVVLKEKAP